MSMEMLTWIGSVHDFSISLDPDSSCTRIAANIVTAMLKDKDIEEFVY